MNEPNDRINEKGTKKQGKALRVTMLILVIVLLLILAAAAAVFIPLYRSFRNSYVKVDIIHGESEDTIPDSPPEGLITLGDDETFPPETEDPDDPIETEEISPSTDPSVTTGKQTDPLTPETKDGKETGKNNPASSEPEVLIGDGIVYKKQKDPNVLNILILGVDTRSQTSFSGRTDVMIVCSYNKMTGEVKLVSLLRDLLVPIKGHDWNRLNTAYAFGGISLCINTINSLFDLDIQKFVIINFEGAKNFIDLCGGVDLPLTAAEVNYINSPKLEQNADGTYHLNGAQALKHMRNRKSGYDFGRTSRQRQVLTAIYRKIAGTRSLSEIYSLIESGFSFIRTNMSLNETFDLSKDVMRYGTGLNIISAYVPKNGTYKNAYYKGKSVISFEIATNKKYLQELLYS